MAKLPEWVFDQLPPPEEGESPDDGIILTGDLGHYEGVAFYEAPPTLRQRRRVYLAGKPRCEHPGCLRVVPPETPLALRAERCRGHWLPETRALKVEPLDLSDLEKSRQVLPDAGILGWLGVKETSDAHAPKSR